MYLLELKSSFSSDKYSEVELLGHMVVLECQVHESRQIGSGQTGDGKSKRRHSRNQQMKVDWNG